MAEETQTDQPASATGGRGPNRPFPPVSLQEVLPIAKTIVSQGMGDRMRRGTLFEKLKRSPDSSKSRDLLSASLRYGLTTGSYRADFITVTEDGKRIAAGEGEVISDPRLAFDCAIANFEPFQQLYERLKDKRIPSESVLCDEITQLGVSLGNSKSAAEVFLANASAAGIIRESQAGGGHRVISIEQVLEETESLPDDDPKKALTPSQIPNAPATAPATQPSERSGPSLHIDVQVHIDSSATTEQIDQIFASMAKHLYGKDG